MSCCCRKYPNTVLVYIIDEDSTVERMDNSYTQLYIDGERTISSQVTNYCVDLFENANLEGFVGVVLVPVLYENDPEEHTRMIERMNSFKNSIPEPYYDKIIITQDVDRNSDYSQILIQAIESLRYIDDPENPIEIDYIITEVDDSGSHHSYDFDNTFLNYYKEYSSDLMYQTLVGLNIDSDYVGELYSNGNFKSYGLIYGIGTKHVIIPRSVSNTFDYTAENWISPIQLFLYRIASYVHNSDRDVNCQLLCKQRYTTFNNNVLLPIAPASFTYDSAGIYDVYGSILNYIEGENPYQQLSNLGSNFDVWSLIKDINNDDLVFQRITKQFLWPFNILSEAQNEFIFVKGAIRYSRLKDLLLTVVGGGVDNTPFPDNPYIDTKLIVSENLLNNFTNYRSLETSNSISYCPCNYYEPINQYYKYRKKV